MTNLSFIRLSAFLASFLAITYTLCMLYGLVVPAGYRMDRAWELILPGFQWLSWVSFLIGLGEVLFYGVYITALYTLPSKLFLRTSS